MNLVCLFFYLFILFAFYAEIQNGHQKWQENDFWEKSPVDSADTMRVKDFIEIALSRFDFRDKEVFAFNAEIQDGRQKSDTLWVKNFVENSFILLLLEINMVLSLTQKFK